MNIVETKKNSKNLQKNTISTKVLWAVCVVCVLVVGGGVIKIYEA